MKINRVITCGFTILILVAFLLNVGSAIFADSSPKVTTNSNRVVKVGISDFPYFMEENEDGTYYGIIIDYLVEIAKYTGWQIEYVEGKSSKLTDMLSTGEIDIMGCMNKNTDSVDLFNFAELSSGYVHSTLIAKNSKAEIIVGDYSSFNGIKVGVYEQATTRIESFKRFDQYNSLSVETVLYDDVEEWEADFESGILDAKLTSSVNLKPDEKIIASFAVEPYYFAITKGRTDITRELNDALLKITNINPGFDTNLCRRYFESKEDNVLAFTLAEQEFIDSSAPLRVVMAPDWAPISMINKSSFDGISIDFIELISKRTGLKFEFMPTQSFEESFELINSGKADIIAGIYDTPFGDKNSDLTLSLPYLPTQTMIIQLKETQLTKMNEVKLAMPFGFDYVSNINDVDIKYYDTVYECFKAVKDGEADFSAISSLAVEDYLRKHGKGKFIMTPSLTAALGLSIAIANPASPELLSIIDKTIYSISEEEKQNIVFSNTSIENSKVSFISFIYSNPTQVIYVVIIGSILVILSLFFVMHMRLKLSEKVAFMGEAYRLIGEFSDEYIFEYNFDSDELKLPEKFANLIRHNIIVHTSEGASDELTNLISSFNKTNLKPKFTTEFRCTVSSGEQEWFRAVCAVLYDSHKKPVKGIGKIISIQDEFTQKQVLEKKANTDALTGLYNKSYCENFVRKYFESSNHINGAAMVIIDFDHFKRVNDTLGHLGGDKAIILLANTLTEMFNDNAIIGRWGGDEFIVFIENISDQSVVIEKIKLFCKKMDTEFVYDGNKCPISVSIGIAFTNNISNYQELFHAADEVLYDVKRNSRNSYKVFG